MKFSRSQLEMLIGANRSGYGFHSLGILERSRLKLINYLEE